MLFILLLIADRVAQWVTALETDFDDGQIHPGVNAEDNQPATVELIPETVPLTPSTLASTLDVPIRSGVNDVTLQETLDIGGPLGTK